MMSLAGSRASSIWPTVAWTRALTQAGEATAAGRMIVYCQRPSPLASAMGYATL